MKITNPGLFETGSCFLVPFWVAPHSRTDLALLLCSHTISHSLLSIVGLIQQTRKKITKKKQIIKINFTINYKNNNSVSGFENFVLELRKTIGNSRYKKNNVTFLKQVITKKENGKHTIKIQNTMVVLMKVDRTKKV